MKIRKLTLAVFIAVCLSVPLFFFVNAESVFELTFVDVSENNKNYAAIEYLVSVNALESYSDGTMWLELLHGTL